MFPSFPLILRHLPLARCLPSLNWGYSSFAGRLSQRVLINPESQSCHIRETHHNAVDLFHMIVSGVKLMCLEESSLIQRFFSIPKVIVYIYKWHSFRSTFIFFNIIIIALIHVSMCLSSWQVSSDYLKASLNWFPDTELNSLLAQTSTAALYSTSKDTGI